MISRGNRAVLRGVVFAAIAGFTATSAWAWQDDAAAAPPEAAAPFELPSLDVDPPPVETPAPAALSSKELYRKGLSTVAFIVARNAEGKLLSTGSGWLLDRQKKLLLTNFHVINNSQATYSVYFPNYVKGRPVTESEQYFKSSNGVPAQVFFGEPKCDLAALVVDEIPETVEEAVLAEESPTPGDEMHSVGNPGTSNALWVYTTGTVRQIYRSQGQRTFGYFDATIIETQSPVNPGDSGGPVLNEAGQLVGVVSSFRMEARLVTQFIDVTEVQVFAAKVKDLFAPQTAAQFVERGNNQKLVLFRPDAAIANYTAALKLQRDHAVAHQMRGDCFLDRKDFPTALADYNDAIAADPTHWPSFTGRSIVHRVLKKPDLAVNDATEAIRLAGNNPFPTFTRGLAYLEQQDHANALKDFNRCVEMAPAFRPALLKRAHVLEHAGNYEAASADYVSAIKLNNLDMEAYSQFGDMLLHRQRNPAQAVSVFSEALKQQPTYAYALVGRARAYMNLDQLELALNDTDEAVKAAPNAPLARDLRGEILLARRDYDAALNEFLAAVKLDQKNARYHVNFGRTLVANGQHKEAIGAFDTAISLNPKDAMTFVRRAVAHFEVGNTAASQADMEHARQLDPAAKELEVKKRYVKYLRMTNATKEPLEIHIQYYTPSVGGEWTWYPGAPGKGPAVVIRIEPGRSGFLIDSNHKDLRIKGSKFRLAAKGLETGNTFLGYQDKDLVVAEPAGYVDVDYHVFDYTLN